MPYIAQVATGKKPHLTIYGGDYETPDGTGIYVKNNNSIKLGNCSAITNCIPFFFYRHKRLCSCNGFSRRTRGSLKKVTIELCKITSNYSYNIFIILYNNMIFLFELTLKNKYYT